MELYQQALMDRFYRFAELRECYSRKEHFFSYCLLKDCDLDWTKVAVLKGRIEGEILGPINLQNHEQVSHRLLREARTLEQQAWATLISHRVDMCWSSWREATPRELWKWGIEILGRYQEVDYEGM